MPLLHVATLPELPHSNSIRPSSTYQKASSSTDMVTIVIIVTPVMIECASLITWWRTLSYMGPLGFCVLNLTLIAYAWICIPVSKVGAKYGEK